MEKVRLDSGIEYEAAPEVAQAYRKARADLSDAQTKADQESARADAAEQAKTEAEKQVEQIKQDAVKTARARLELEGVAKEHKVEIKEDSTDRALKESVIAAIRGDADLSEKSDAYVDAAYDLAVSDSAKRRDDAAEQRKVATTINQDGKQGASAKSAREQMAARMRGEKAGDEQ